VTRRLLQAIAGARYGGAETFFVRLAAALQRAGENQRVPIRRDPCRARRLREDGVAVDFLPNFVPDLRSAVTPRAAAPAGNLLAVALGRLDGNKGFELLLEALTATRRVELWIAGDGPLRARLERMALRLGIARRVGVLGWRDDLPALLARAIS
jgi:glycosyltransferase involved in cell wall biosynthesis